MSGWLRHLTSDQLTSHQHHFASLSSSLHPLRLSHLSSPLRLPYQRRELFDHSHHPFCRLWIEELPAAHHRLRRSFPSLPLPLVFVESCLPLLTPSYLIVMENFD